MRSLRSRGAEPLPDAQRAHEHARKRHRQTDEIDLGDLVGGAFDEQLLEDVGRAPQLGIDAIEARLRHHQLLGIFQQLKVRAHRHLEEIDQIAHRQRRQVARVIAETPAAEHGASRAWRVLVKARTLGHEIAAQDALRERQIVTLQKGDEVVDDRDVALAVQVDVLVLTDDLAASTASKRRGRPCRENVRRKSSRLRSIDVTVWPSLRSQPARRGTDAYGVFRFDIGGTTIAIRSTVTPAVEYSPSTRMEFRGGMMRECGEKKCSRSESNRLHADFQSADPRTPTAKFLGKSAVPIVMEHG